MTTREPHPASELRVLRFHGAHILYLLPHADDELFVAGILAANAGETQSIVWLTHGGFLSGLRRIECGRVARWLERAFGVSCRSLGLPDGRLAANRVEAVARLEALHLTPSVVVTTEPEGEHADHDAAFAIGRDAFPHCRVVTVPCYDRGVGRRRIGRPRPAQPDAWRSVTMGAPLRRLRLTLLRRYPSQWGILLPMALAGGAAFLATQWIRGPIAITERPGLE